SSRRRHTSFSRDWSSDVCSSDLDYLFNNRDTDESVLQAAETAIREIVGKSKMDFVLYEGREQVAAQATVLMQEILDRYQTGILRSEERRVGKECRDQPTTYHRTK